MKSQETFGTRTCVSDQNHPFFWLNLTEAEPSEPRTTRSEIRLKQNQVLSVCSDAQPSRSKALGSDSTGDQSRAHPVTSPGQTGLSERTGPESRPEPDWTPETDPNTPASSSGVNPPPVIVPHPISMGQSVSTPWLDVSSGSNQTTCLNSYVTY